MGEKPEKEVEIIDAQKSPFSFQIFRFLIAILCSLLTSHSGHGNLRHYYVNSFDICTSSPLYFLKTHTKTSEENLDFDTGLKRCCVGGN